MDDLNPERDAFAAVDHALRTLPTASPPSLLAKNIMARIRVEAQPRFRLTWFDYALSACGASMAIVALFLLQSLAITEMQSTLLVNRLLADLWNLFATGCWYCAR